MALGEVIEFLQVGPGLILGVLSAEGRVAEVASHAGNARLEFARLRKGEELLGLSVGLVDEVLFEAVVLKGNEPVPLKSVPQVFGKAHPVVLRSAKELGSVQKGNGLLHVSKIRGRIKLNRPFGHDSSARQPRLPWRSSNRTPRRPIVWPPDPSGFAPPHRPTSGRFSGRSLRVPRPR